MKMHESFSPEQAGNDDGQQNIPKDQSESLALEQAETMRRSVKILQSKRADLVRLYDDIQKYPGEDSTQLLHDITDAIRAIDDHISQSNYEQLHSWNSELEHILADTSYTLARALFFEHENFRRQAESSHIPADAERQYHKRLGQDVVGQTRFQRVRDLAREKDKQHFAYLVKVLDEIDDWNSIFDMQGEQLLENDMLDRGILAVENGLQTLEAIMHTFPTDKRSSPEYTAIRNTYIRRREEFLRFLTGRHAQSQERVYGLQRARDLAVENARVLIVHKGSIAEARSFVQSQHDSLMAEWGTSWPSAKKKAVQQAMLTGYGLGLLEMLQKEYAATQPNTVQRQNVVRVATDLAISYRKLPTKKDQRSLTVYGAHDSFNPDVSNDDLALRFAALGSQMEECVFSYAQQAEIQHPLHVEISTMQSEANEKLNTKEKELELQLSAVGKTLRDLPEYEDYIQMRNTIQSHPTTLQKLSEKYAVLCHVLGRNVASLEWDIRAKMQKFYKEAELRLQQDVLDTGRTGANAQTLEEATGVHFDEYADVALQLLGSIKGFGTARLSDETWQYIHMASDIAITIGVGVGVGIATGGLGLLPSAAMAATATHGVHKLRSREGYDSAASAAYEIGGEVAIGMVSAKIGDELFHGWSSLRALSAKGALAGRNTDDILASVLQAKPPASPQVLQSIGKSVKDVLAATGETVLLEGAETVVDSALETAVFGGDFLQNLQANALFFGWGVGRRLTGESVAALARTIAQTNNARQHAIVETNLRLAQSVQDARTQCTDIHTGIDLATLVQHENPQQYLALVNVPAEKHATVLALRQSLIAASQKARLLVDVPLSSHAAKHLPDVVPDVRNKEEVLSYMANATQGGRLKDEQRLALFEARLKAEDIIPEGAVINKESELGRAVLAGHNEEGIVGQLTFSQVRKKAEAFIRTLHNTNLHPDLRRRIQREAFACGFCGEAPDPRDVIGKIVRWNGGPGLNGLRTKVLAIGDKEVQLRNLDTGSEKVISRSKYDANIQYADIETPTPPAPPAPPPVKQSSKQQQAAPAKAPPPPPKPHQIIQQKRRQGPPPPPPPPNRKIIQRAASQAPTTTPGVSLSQEERMPLGREPIDQLMATHCTHGTSAIKRGTGNGASDTLGYSARSSTAENSSAVEDLYKEVKSLLSYYLPSGAPKNLSPENAPQNLQRSRTTQGRGVLLHGAYREKSTDNRTESYFIHALLEPEQKADWKATDCLRCWKAPAWVMSDNPSIPHVAQKLDPTDLLKGKKPAVCDSALQKFLTTEGDTNNAQSVDPHLVPMRWQQMPIAQRREMLTNALAAYLQAQSRGQKCVIAAEPGMSALLFYGIAKALPVSYRPDGIDFATYKGASSLNSTGKLPQLTGTTFMSDTLDAVHMTTLQNISKKAVVYSTFPVAQGVPNGLSSTVDSSYQRKAEQMVQALLGSTSRPKSSVQNIPPPTRSQTLNTTRVAQQADSVRGNPVLQPIVQKSLQLANTPDVEFSAELLPYIQGAATKKIPVCVHAHMFGGGYQNVFNQSEGCDFWGGSSNAPILKKNSLSYIRDLSVNSDINTLSHERIYLNPTTKHDKKVIVYLYSSDAYTDTTPQKREGVCMNIYIALPAQEAHRVYTLLQQNPEQARAFFIAAAQSVKHADYLWSQRTPPYASDKKRSIIYIDPASHIAANKKVSEVSDVVAVRYLKKQDRDWVESDLPPDAQECVQKAQVVELEIWRLKEKTEQLLQQIKQLAPGKDIAMLNHRYNLEKNPERCRVIIDALNITDFFRKYAKKLQVLRKEFSPEAAKEILRYLTK